MEDYLIREIDRIGEMLAYIASKLGLGSMPEQSEVLGRQLNSELVKALDIDYEVLLAMSAPIEYLVVEKCFTNANLEELAVMMYRALPASDKLNGFLSDVTAYLDHQGVFSFVLHSI
jgi:hypothetical protein